MTQQQIDRYEELRAELERAKKELEDLNADLQIVRNPPKACWSGIIEKYEDAIAIDIENRIGYFQEEIFRINDKIKAI